MTQSKRRIAIRLAAALSGVLLLAPPLSCTKRSTGVKPQPDTDLSAAWLPQPAFAKTPGDGVSIADVAERVTPSVVSISATKVKTQQAPRSPFFEDPFFQRFFGPWNGMPQERRERGLGSGVVISEDGTILTNHHVVEDAEEIVVHTTDKREFKATIQGSDPKSDLAVLKLEGDISGLKPLPLGDSDQLRLGDVVLAVGNPFGVGQTVTMGIVSAKGRANVGIVDYEDFIQTDAAINPGNSGGALVSLEGKLVGINTAILSRSGGYQGIGFAIPSNMVKPIMQSLLEHGKVVRGWLGIVIQDVNADLAAALGVEQLEGVLIADVKEGGPAATGGLERGDIVLRINGKKTNSTGQLRNLVAAAGAGQTVTVDILRKGKEQTLKVKLGEAPHSSSEGEGREDSSDLLAGLAVDSLSAQNRARFDLPKELHSGVVVTGADRKKWPLVPGDVILEVNRKKVTSPNELRRAYSDAKGVVLLLVHRKGGTIFLTVPKHK